MTILIFGSRGRTGSAVVAEAHTRGIQVRAFDKKSPASEELRAAHKGVDASIIVFGPRPPYTDIFCAEATQHIIWAMEAEHVKRLICVTGAMIGEYPANRSIAFKLMRFAFRTVSPDGYGDRVKQEDIVKRSSLDWTIVKPPRLNTDEKGGAITAGMQVKVGLLSILSRKSLAQFIVNEAVNPRHIREAVFIKGA